MPRSSIAAATLLVCAVCHAQPSGTQPSRRPAPDPWRGERSDGRISGPPNYKEGLLLVPRILLAPLRLIWKGLAVVAESGARMDEKYRIRSHVYHLLTSDDGSRGVRPEITYSFTFAPFLGLSYFDRKLLGDNTYLRATLTTGGLNRWLFRLQLRPTESGRTLRLDMDTSYFRRNDLLFPGLGDFGQPLTRYAVDAVDFGGRLTWRVVPMLHLYGRAAFALQRFGNGEGNSELPILDVYCVRTPSGECTDSANPALVPGFNRGSQILSGGVGVTFDSRNGWTKPSSGFLGDASLDYAHGIVSDPSSYFRARVTAQAFINLWGRSRVLVVRAASEMVLPTGETPVTFYQLPWLGGPSEHRGMRWMRLRDYSTLLMTVEYRWPIWMWADAVLFMDAGGVGGKWYRDLEQIHPSVGGGLRLRSADTFWVRVDAAWSPFDGFQLYLSTSAVP